MRPGYPTINLCCQKQLQRPKTQFPQSYSFKLNGKFKAIVLLKSHINLSGFTFELDKQSIKLCIVIFIVFGRHAVRNKLEFTSEEEITLIWLYSEQGIISGE